MTPALLLLALSAEPSVATAEVEPDVPRLVVSVYPGGLTAGAAYGVTRGGTYFYLPVGISFPLRGDLSIDVDVAGSFNQGRFSNGGGGSFSIAVGPTWFPWAKKGLDGFFIGPRFQFEVSKPLPEEVLFDVGPFPAPLPLGSGIRRAFLIGLDIGWQFRFEHVVLGPVFGVSYGFAYDNAESVISPFDQEASFFFPPRFPSGFAPSVNLSLFKVGGVF